MVALMQEHDSVDEAAEAAIAALDEHREQDMLKTANRPFAVLMQASSGGLVYTYGPYATESKAKRALTELCSPSKTEKHSAGVFRLYGIRSEP